MTTAVLDHARPWVKPRFYRLIFLPSGRYGVVAHFDDEGPVLMPWRWRSKAEAERWMTAARRAQAVLFGPDGDDEGLRVCEVCTSQFVAHQANQKLCSMACAEVRRRRKGARV